MCARKAEQQQEVRSLHAGAHLEHTLQLPLRGYRGLHAGDGEHHVPRECSLEAAHATVGPCLDQCLECLFVRHSWWVANVKQGQAVC